MTIVPTATIRRRHAFDEQTHLGFSADGVVACIHDGPAFVTQVAAQSSAAEAGGQAK